MKTIFKYEINFYHGTIEMPKDAKIISLQLQGDIPCIWAIVEPTEPKVSRSFIVYETGQPLQGFYEELEYIGTYQRECYVLHVFEEKQ